MSKIKAEIERFLQKMFIRPAKYVEWLANIVLVVKKNDTLRVCINFRDLNDATPKDEYQMLVVEMLVDLETRFEYLSLINGYYGYDHIIIVEEDKEKTTF